MRGAKVQDRLVKDELVFFPSNPFSSDKYFLSRPLLTLLFSTVIFTSISQGTNKLPLVVHQIAIFSSCSPMKKVFLC